jgi:hypothetical protein
MRVQKQLSPEGEDILPRSDRESNCVEATVSAPQALVRFLDTDSVRSLCCTCKAIACAISAAAAARDGRSHRLQKPQPLAYTVPQQDVSACLRLRGGCPDVSRLLCLCIVCMQGRPSGGVSAFSSPGLGATASPMRVQGLMEDERGEDDEVSPPHKRANQQGRGAQHQCPAAGEAAQPLLG